MNTNHTNRYGSVRLGSNGRANLKDTGMSGVGLCDKESFKLVPLGAFFGYFFGQAKK
jgi:hypothetical protein